MECYCSCGDVSHGCMRTHSHIPPKTAQFYSINQCHFPFLGSCSPVPYSIILLTRSAFLPLMWKSIATLNSFHNQFFYHRSTKLLPVFKNGNTLKGGKKSNRVFKVLLVLCWTTEVRVYFSLYEVWIFISKHILVCNSCSQVTMFFFLLHSWSFICPEIVGQSFSGSAWVLWWRFRFMII